MNCQDYHELLQRRLDGEEIADSADQAAHLATCGECRGLHVAARRFEAGMRLLRHPVPAANLSERIVNSVLAQQRAARRRRLLVRAVGAMAASLLAAGLIGLWANRRGQEERPAPAPPIAQQAPQPGGPSAGPSLRESMTEVAQLTMRRADETVRTLLPDANPNDSAASPFTASVASLREAGNSVSAGLEPVTDSARRALDLFLREIPQVRAEDKRGS
jgi:hypothetical protein